MVAYARARTRSWLSMLWPDIINLDKSEALIDKQSKQNKRFLEQAKNGGIWFS